MNDPTLFDPPASPEPPAEPAAVPLPPLGTRPIDEEAVKNLIQKLTKQQEDIDRIRSDQSQVAAWARLELGLTSLCISVAVLQLLYAIHGEPAKSRQTTLQLFEWAGIENPFA